MHAVQILLIKSLKLVACRKNLHVEHILRFLLLKQVIYHTVKSKLAENDRVTTKAKV